MPVSQTARLESTKLAFVEYQRQKKDQRRHL